MKIDKSSIVVSQNALPPAPDEEGGLAIGQIFTAIRRRAFIVIGVTVVVASLAQLKALSDKPVYTGGFEILTKSVTGESEVISSVPDTLSNRQQSTPPQVLDATKIRVLLSPSLLNPIVEELKPRYPGINYGTLIQGLRIQPNGETILSVIFTSEDAQLVEDVLKIVSQRYLDYSLEERQRDIRQGIKFVEEQLPELEQRVASQQDQLEQFRQRYNLIDPQSQAQILSSQASALAQQQLDTQTQLNQARSLYREIQQELAGQPAENASASALSQSTRYQRLLDQLLDIDSKLAQESALYLDTSPEIQVLREQRRNLEPLLQREGQRVERVVISNIRELEARSLALSRSIAEVNDRIKTLSTITREYNDIQRNLEIATTNLNQFLAKREGLRIDASQRQVPWQLLTPPGEPMPSSASVKRSLILGVILGSLLGVGVALLLDRLSNVIASAKQVKNITKLPTLGVIPLNRELDTFEGMHTTLEFLRTGSDSLEFVSESSSIPYSTPFQEAFRTLNANLRLLNPDVPIRSVTISSPAPGNGKTTISSHLALTAAAMGQRVLIVDTDLRRPRLHEQLGLKNEVGLTDVVSSGVDFREVIQPIAWESNAFVLSSGTVPPDPTRILASQAMQSLIKKLTNEFDLVIYDTPPMLGFADVSLLAAQTDGLLLVVRLNQIKQSLLEQAIDELRISKVPVIGTVVNASEEQPFTFYAYYDSSSESVPVRRSHSTLKPSGLSLTHAMKRLKARLKSFR